MFMFWWPILFVMSIMESTSGTIKSFISRIELSSPVWRLLPRIILWGFIMIAICMGTIGLLSRRSRKGIGLMRLWRGRIVSWVPVYINYRIITMNILLAGASAGSFALRWWTVTSWCNLRHLCMDLTLCSCDTDKKHQSLLNTFAESVFISLFLFTEGNNLIILEFC